MVDDAGNVVGFEDAVTPTPSHRLKAGQAASVKSVSMRPSGLKVELHDKLAALDKLGRLLGLFQDAAPAPSVTVNQMNVGEQPALELARKLAFALAAAQRPAIAAPAEPPTIKGIAAWRSSPPPRAF